MVNLRVEPIFLVVQVHPREQGVFREDEVADDAAREHARLRQLLHLIDALKEEEQLRLKCMCARVAVEAFEKRVLTGLFKQQIGAEVSAELARERTLPHADRPLDGDVREPFQQPSHWESWAMR